MDLSYNNLIDYINGQKIDCFNEEFFENNLMRAIEYLNNPNDYKKMYDNLDGLVSRLIKDGLEPEQILKESIKKTNKTAKLTCISCTGFMGFSAYLIGMMDEDKLPMINLPEIAEIGIIVGVYIAFNVIFKKLFTKGEKEMNLLLDNYERFNYCCLENRIKTNIHPNVDRIDKLKELSARVIIFAENGSKESDYLQQRFNPQ